MTILRFLLAPAALMALPTAALAAPIGLDNGRPTVVSADGDFSLSLRSLVQLDYGYFAQGKNRNGLAQLVL